MRETQIPRGVAEWYLSIPSGNCAKSPKGNSNTPRQGQGVFELPEGDLGGQIARGRSQIPQGEMQGCKIYFSSWELIFLLKISCEIFGRKISHFFGALHVKTWVRDFYSFKANKRSLEEVYRPFYAPPPSLNLCFFVKKIGIFWPACC